MGPNAATHNFPYPIDYISRLREQTRALARNANAEVPFLLTVSRL